MKCTENRMLETSNKVRGGDVLIAVLTIANPEAKPSGVYKVHPNWQENVVFNHLCNTSIMCLSSLPFFITFRYVPGSKYFYLIFFSLYVCMLQQN